MDDLLVASNSENMILDVEQKLKDNFTLKVTLNPKFFVGFEIENKVIRLSQFKYIEKLLKKFQLSKSKPQFTPMETNLRIMRPTDGVDDTEYRSMIGGLLYLARLTRPDIAFSVNYLSRFQTCSNEQLKNYAKRIFKYIKHTRNFVLKFCSDDKGIIAFIDASYAPEVDIHH